MGERTEGPEGRVESAEDVVERVVPGTGGLRNDPMVGRSIGPLTGLQVPAGFTKSLFPTRGLSTVGLIAPINTDVQKHLSSLIRPITESMLDHAKVMLPTTTLLGTSALKDSALGSLSSGFNDMILPWTRNLPALNLINTDALDLFKGIGDQFAKLLQGLNASIGPLIDQHLFQGLKLSFLPPNLEDAADEIRFHDVQDFIQQEGIPLYLVPRGRTALRLIRAKDRPTRRRILGECFVTLMDDCEAVLMKVTHPRLRDEVAFALDGLGAMRAGHTRSAQAMFTVTLDTLIYGFYPDRNERRAVTNRKKNAEVPESFDEMGVHEAMVWLPIWNAHEQFWKDKGDEIPRHYSRHASVHGVSSRQFSKRNCVQVLMLVTSLIGYAEEVL